MIPPRGARGPGWFAGGLGRRLRLAWGLADQAVASLGNFATGILLLQWLPKTEFGQFFLAFSLLLFLNGLHAALVTYPLSVHGAVGPRAGLRRQSGQALGLTLLLAPIFALGLAALFAGSGRSGLIPFAFAAMLAWQLQETLRRGLMARLRHRDALPGDAIAYLGRAAVILGLAQLGLLSLETAFLAMTATALAGGLLQAWQLRPRRPRACALRATLGAHWRLGRWMALTGLVTLFAVQAVPWTLGAAHGMAPVAEFAALEQVMGVANPVLIGLAGLIVPAVAAAVPQGMAAVRRAAWGFGLQGGALLVPFCAAVLLAPETAIRLVTFNDAYAGLGGALRPIAVAWTLLLPAMVAQALLNGLGRPRAGFAAQAVFAATTVVVTLPAAIAFGLPGAAWAGLVPAAAFAGVSVWLAWRATAVAVAPAPRGMVPAPDQARAVG